MWTVAIAIGVLALGVVIGSWGTGLAEDRLASLGIDPISRYAIAGGVRPISVAVVLLAALGIVGIPAWQAVLAVSAAGLAVGVLAKEPLRLLGASVVVRSAGILRTGERVDLGGHTGTVVDIGRWTVTLRNNAGALVSVPLSAGLAGVVNHTRGTAA
jgi:small conductance mechanosensitive channel